MSRFTRPTGHASPPQHVTLYSRTSVAFSLVSFPFFSFSVTSSTCHALLAQQVTRHRLNMSRFTQGLQSPSLSSVSHSFLFLSLPQHVTLYSPNRSRVTPSTCHALLTQQVTRHSLDMSRFTHPTGHASLPRHVTLYSPNRSRVTPSTCHALLTQNVMHNLPYMSCLTLYFRLYPPCMLFFCPFPVQVVPFYALVSVNNITSGLVHRYWFIDLSVQATLFQVG